MRRFELKRLQKVSDTLSTPYGTELTTHVNAREMHIFGLGETQADADDDAIREMLGHLNTIERQIASLRKDLTDALQSKTDAVEAPARDGFLPFDRTE